MAAAFADQFEFTSVLTSGFPIVPEHLYNIHHTPSENNNSRLAFKSKRVVSHTNQITLLH
jgi:hypothetical protein